MKIKVCGIKDMSVLNGLLESPPDYLGFIFFPLSKRYLDMESDPSIMSGLTRSVKRVGVFVNERIEVVLKVCNKFSLDLIQLHGEETRSYCKELKSHHIEIIKAFRINKNSVDQGLAKYEDVCDYFLFDTRTDLFGGSGVKFDWNLLDRLNIQKPFFLSGGIGPDDVHQIWAFSHRMLHAIDINSKFEKKPGLKDIQKVTSFIKNIRNKSQE